MSDLVPRAQAANNETSSSGEKAVTVTIRVRPAASGDTSGQPAGCLTFPDQQTVQCQAANTPDAKKFRFDHVLKPESTNEQVFQATARPLIAKALDGYNACCFAYGQTGSGKTHTILGDDANKGIVYFTADVVFDRCKAEKKFIWEVECSFLEIYQEHLRDLLNFDQTEGSSAGGGLKIREDPDKGIFVSDCTKEVVKTRDDIIQVMRKGQESRIVGETAANKRSSRSHAILTLYISRTEKGDESGLTQTSSKFHLIDLAGSERQAHTGATGDRLKEGAGINKSLSALGNVINTLAKGGGGHIPYRDSKLTRFLQDSLGGNSFTTVVCTVSPLQKFSDESMSTLRFAERAKKMKNKPQQNIDPRALLLEENRLLRQRIAELEGALRKCTCGAANGINLASSVPSLTRSSTRMEHGLQKVVSRVVLSRTRSSSDVGDGAEGAINADDVVVQENTNNANVAPSHPLPSIPTSSTAVQTENTSSQKKCCIMM